MLIKITSEILNTQGCVFKISCGDKYIIGMCNYLWHQIKSINSDIYRWNKGTPKSGSFKNQFVYFLNFIKANPEKEPLVTLVFRSGNPYFLLKRCQIELDEAVNDANCLNKEFTPYLAPRIQTPKMYWKDKGISVLPTPYWINRGHYLNFRRWQAGRGK